MQQHPKIMNTDGFGDRVSESERIKADLDLCLSLIRDWEIQLETAINLYYLAILEGLPADEVNTFRQQLGLRLDLMAESLIRFQVSRTKRPSKE